MFVTGDEAFDDDAAAFIDGHCESSTHFLFGHHIGEHAAAMVAVRWFDDHRQADIFGRGPGFVGSFDDFAFGHGHATGLEQALGQILVARNGLGDGAGLVGFGRPDAALFGAVAQLH